MYACMHECMYVCTMCHISHPHAYTCMPSFFFLFEAFHCSMPLVTLSMDSYRVGESVCQLSQVLQDPWSMEYSSHPWLLLNWDLVIWIYLLLSILMHLEGNGKWALVLYLYCKCQLPACGFGFAPLEGCFPRNLLALSFIFLMLLPSL